MNPNETQGALAGIVVLDLTRTSALDPAARRRFLALAATLSERGKSLVLATRHKAPDFESILAFDKVDAALEWAEWELLGSDREAVRDGVTLETHPLTSTLTDAQRATIEAVSTVRPFATGDLLVQTGEPAAELYLLMAGEVSVLTQGTRLSTLLPGAIFGEMALHGSSRRSADIVAAQDGELLAVPLDAFEGFAQTDVALQAGLLRGLLESSNEIVLRLTRQVAALS